MPLFALPLPRTYKSLPPKPQLSYLPIRKRKSSASPSDTDNEKSFTAESTDNKSSLTAASTNPLSLTPDEIAQYRLAGLELDKELPGKKVRGWPHRGFGPLELGEAGRKKRKKGKEKEKERDDSGYGETEGEDDNIDAEGEKEWPQRTGTPWLRMQHFEVLTAILQRCLLEGDFERASRAWALLIRAQIDGKGIDTRSSGYWGIGAELLIRGLERQGSVREANENKDSDFDSEYHDDGDGEKDGGDEELNMDRRWGTAEGLEKAKEYYERLILQHPYRRQFEQFISALDFWPPMLGCEIYGIQYMQKEALKRISALETQDDDEDNESSSESSFQAYNHDDEEMRDAAMERKERRRHRRKAEQIWTEREEVRNTTLRAMERIAIRMEQLMTTPPYSDSHILLRLRGMVALYIGDLNVPEAPIIKDGDGEEDADAALLHGDTDAEYRLLMIQRRADYRRGQQRQEEERNRARTLFWRIKKEGGVVGDMEALLLQNEDENENENENKGEDEDEGNLSDAE
ncbi:hypothetical protein B7494_g5217 [Chlorociboria aeruginascens]|nr:hypothetical protein B7494_g5217 [Chlorociboria aeruginascens]